MPLCCSASSAILYPRIVCYYKSQWAPRLIGRRRRSSDVTVGYITYSETAHHCFQVGYRTSIWGAPLWRRNPTWTFIHSPIGQKTKRIKLTRIRRLSTRDGPSYFSPFCQGGQRMRTDRSPELPTDAWKLPPHPSFFYLSAPRKTTPID
ncbi:hypothetical protein AMECASPLE_037159 [Ameca splendens]|uniref:Uncharacterized protein n=1 Tax=Ameca splendens TaxID=208324 RepID=A0ABV0ZSS7_9TELE